MREHVLLLTLVHLHGAAGIGRGEQRLGSLPNRRIAMRGQTPPARRAQRGRADVTPRHGIEQNRHEAVLGEQRREHGVADLRRVRLPARRRHQADRGSGIAHLTQRANRGQLDGGLPLWLQQPQQCGARHRPLALTQQLDRGQPLLGRRALAQRQLRGPRHLRGQSLASEPAWRRVV